jgi:hypothetical protein
MKNKSLVIHPFLFALLPVISLLSYNLNDLPLVQVVRPTLIILSCTLLLWGFLWVWLRNWERAALWLSPFLIIFFSYGHIYSGLLHPASRSLFSRIGLLNRHDRLLLVWLAIFVLVVWIMERLKRRRREITQMLNWMALFALLMPFYQIARHEYVLNQPLAGEAQVPLQAAQASAVKPATSPDIYYIILDGYGRADILQEFMHYDNVALRSELSRLGFIVAEQSRSNYTQTSLSLASSLNMIYLDSLGQEIAGQEDRLPMARLIRWNNVLRFLQSQGYQTVAFASGYRATELDQADHFQRATFSGVSWLERLIIDTSMLVIWQGLALRFGIKWEYPGYQAHRQTIRYIYANLPEAARLPGPKFVFAHIISPHPPFVFDAEGRSLSPGYPFTLLDGSAFPDSPDEYERSYAAQIAYVDQRVLEMVHAILSNSASPAVIVIQGDHGPGSRFNWSLLEEPGLHERLGILNAYRLPGVDPTLIYSTITPVNTFRLVLNQYFGADLPLLPDRSFYSTWDQPYQFIEVP